MRRSVDIALVHVMRDERRIALLEPAEAAAAGRAYEQLVAFAERHRVPAVAELAVETDLAASAGPAACQPRCRIARPVRVERDMDRLIGQRFEQELLAGAAAVTSGAARALAKLFRKQPQRRLLLDHLGRRRRDIAWPRQNVGAVLARGRAHAAVQENLVRVR